MTYAITVSHVSDFDNQSLGCPPWRLSDLFGAFNFSKDPLDVNNTNKVLKMNCSLIHSQVFHHVQNWMNYNISARVSSMNKEKDNTVSVCGLIQSWDPNK